LNTFDIASGFIYFKMLGILFSLSASKLLGLAVGPYVLFLFVQYLLDPLRGIPGPFLARFTRFWYLYAIWKGDFELTDVEFHRTYGPIWRVAPGEYSVDDVDAAKTIYGHGTAFVKVGISSLICLKILNKFYVLTMG
jgi:hypothetical protein